MATNRKTYVEPASYFSPSMRKVATEWDKKNAEKQKQASKTGSKKK